MGLPQTQTLTERMARARRSQEQRMGGVAPPAAAAPRAPIPAANEPRLAAAPSRDIPKERAGRLWEFEALLPAMVQLYGYGEADVAGLRAAVAAPGQKGDVELSLCVRQWRIDVVAHGLDGLLPDGAARRARIQFRQAVMGERVDENGDPYRPDALDWVPEPAVTLVNRPRPR